MIIVEGNVERDKKGTCGEAEEAGKSKDVEKGIEMKEGVDSNGRGIEGEKITG